MCYSGDGTKLSHKRLETQCASFLVTAGIILAIIRVSKVVIPAKAGIHSAEGGVNCCEVTS
jgi:hypothetical protein